MPSAGIERPGVRRLAFLVAGLALVASTVAVGLLYERSNDATDGAPVPAASGTTTTLVPLESDGSAQVLVRVTSASGTTVVLAIGPWQRDVMVPAGTTTYSFSPPVDLAEPVPPLVVTGEAVTVEVDTGRRPDAVIVNDGWRFSPRSPS